MNIIFACKYYVASSQTELFSEILSLELAIVLFANDVTSEFASSSSDCEHVYTPFDVIDCEM